MPNYALKFNNKSYDLGFFVCDMEADDYAISKLNLNSKDKYSIIETVVDSLDRTAIQMELQNRVD
jgi:hypothetical protein